MRTTIPGCAILLLGFAIAGPAQAQWKWRDAGGLVNYSDQPPPASVPAKNILTMGGAARTAALPAGDRDSSGAAAASSATAGAAPGAAQAQAADASGGKAAPLPAEAARDGAQPAAAAGAADARAGGPAGAQAAAAPARPRSAAERLNELRKQQAEKEAALRKNRDQEQLEARVAQWCEDLRARERTLASGLRMARVDAAGEQSFVTDEERESQLRALRRDLQAQCGAGT